MKIEAIVHTEIDEGVKTPLAGSVVSPSENVGELSPESVCCMC
jgi:hypothetical protein